MTKSSRPIHHPHEGGWIADAVPPDERGAYHLWCAVSLATVALHAMQEAEAPIPSNSPSMQLVDSHEAALVAADALLRRQAADRAGAILRADGYTMIPTAVVAGLDPTRYDPCALVYDEKAGLYHQDGPVHFIHADAYSQADVAHTLALLGIPHKLPHAQA